MAQKRTRSLNEDIIMTSYHPWLSDVRTVAVTVTIWCVKSADVVSAGYWKERRRRASAWRPRLFYCYEV